MRPIRALVAASLFLACAGGGPPARPDIVVVTLDTTRADHLGCYGYFRDTSPRIDAFAAGSVFFERCLTPMAMTLPAHTSLFTGVYPTEHGILTNRAFGGRKFHPTDRLRAFAQYASDAGYATAAFVSATPLKRYAGLAVGFDVYDQPEDFERMSPVTTDRALEWLDAHPDGPVFLWVHYFDPHWPHDPPEATASVFSVDAPLESWIRERGFPLSSAGGPGRDMEMIADQLNRYDGEILGMDAEFGRLVDRVLARNPDTAVLVLGDHGEGLYEHDEFQHGGTWDEQLHVPLLMRASGAAPRRVGAPVSSVDALPTFLGLLGASCFDGFLDQSSGRNALDPRFEPTPVVGQDDGYKIDDLDYRYSITSERGKFFWWANRDEPSGSYFDLAGDPFELVNVVDARRDEAVALYERLQEDLGRQRKRAAEFHPPGSETPGETEPVDSAIVEELKALGYLEK